jgi:type IV pilus assembly protein PilQ|tara:strand:+ start:1417 stop:2970 length:1554 start_codon:yes stop_codon:yes gene_type:complete
MKFKNNISFILIPFLILLLNGCADKFAKKSKAFKHDTPLIKTDVKQLGKIELEKSAKMGPVPIDGDVIKLKKRKQLSSVKERNYLLISEEFTSLKQNVSFKFQGLDFKEAMSLMAEIGKINILVGDEVAGAVSAELDNVPWDKAFNALLDLKSYAADIDVASNIIRVSTPANLTSQESYKSARASAVKKKVEIEDSVEPIISEIFRLYYITPAEAKATITELFTTVGTGGNFIPIQVTEEATTRSVIVRGKEKDLDIVDKVIREIDKRTKQVLIEAFIVEATSSFEQNLGKRLGVGYTRNKKRIGGILDGNSTIGAPSGESSTLGNTTAQLGTGNDNLLNVGAGAATAGIGILKKTGSAVLKIELDALESEGLSKTVSNPKLFTLDNQQASINQGETIYVDGGEGEDKPVDASLKLIVTPNIIGDGNVMLQIQVNNDTPNRSNPGTPGINKMEINTKLLVADGDIVVIGGIKKNNVASGKDGVPGVSKIPVVGKALSGSNKSDTMNELLVFIAPRIL